MRSKDEYRNQTQPGMLRADEKEAGKGRKKQLLGTGIPCTEIISVIFTNTLAGMPKEHWDVSMQGDGSVAAWTEMQEDGYVFYIAGEGGVAGNPDCGSLFRNCSRVREIRFQGCFDTSQVTDMECMFYGCTSLEELDIVGFDTSRVTNMGGMFGQCRSLVKLDVGSFDTSRVTDMKFMFGNCRSLVQLDVSGFDTSRVTDMQGMFGSCRSLAQLDVSGFDTSCVTDMKDMFKGCRSLAQLDTGGFDLSRTEASEGMYDGLDSGIILVKGEKLIEQKLLRADALEEGSRKKACFLGTGIACADILSVEFLDTLAGMPEEHWDVSAAGNESVQAWAQKDGNGYAFFIAAQGGVMANPNCRDLFRDCVRLRKIRFQDCFDTSRVRDMSRMFRGCRSLEELELRSFDTARVTDMHDMFWNCSRLEKLETGSFDTLRVKDMSFMFAACMSLKKLEVQGFDTSKVRNMQGMFYNCSSLEELDTGSFCTAGAADMEKMFAGCSSIKALDVSGFDTSRAVRMRSMFAGCKSLESLDVSSFDFSHVEDQEDMFSGCGRLFS